jgi:sulfate adenylyltransferase
MADLIPPHGGVNEPINRTVADLGGPFAKNIVLSDADLSSLYRIGDGALSPLTGPMTSEEWNRVLDEEVVIRGGKKYAWTIPIAFPITDVEAAAIKVGDTVGLKNSSGATVGKLTVGDVYAWDKPKYIKGVYSTERTDHPGGKMATSDPRTKLVGGEAWALPQPKNAEYGQFVLSPKESRALFAKKGWQRVVAFQTRNALHRAHEYALVVGLERLTRAGHNAGAVLNPLIGETKSDDVDALTRMRTYKALIDNKAIGQGDKDEALWKSKGYDLNDRLILLGLDIKMFYGGPKEAIMHGIYRQNYGFTDIVIGRKHADAPYDDGKDIWDGLAAQRKFDELKGELKIQPVKVGFAAFYAELDKVALVDDVDKTWKPVSISGRDLREQLRAGTLPDPRIMRPETAKVLIAKMKAS